MLQTLQSLDEADLVLYEAKLLLSSKLLRLEPT